jgi:FlaA1/EpsC-like NDP-sugar epimerase
VIFHCAAYKHVPMMEENQVAAVQNNVFGTQNLLDAALKYNVEKFVLISTDKAVSPCSVYGVSKMLCEKMVLEASKHASKNQAIMLEILFANGKDTKISMLIDSLLLVN